jgi:hypothetical protein
MNKTGKLWIFGVKMLETVARGEIVNEGSLQNEAGLSRTVSCQRGKAQLRIIYRGALKRPSLWDDQVGKDAPDQG